MAPDRSDYCPQCRAYVPGCKHPSEEARNDQGQVRMTIYVRTQTGEAPLQAYLRMTR